MDKRKFNRVPEDTSQQQLFVEETIDAINEHDTKIEELESKPSGTKLYLHSLSIVPSSAEITIGLTVIATSDANFYVQGGPPVPRIASGVILSANWGNGSETTVSYNSEAIYGTTITISNNKTDYSFVSCTISSHSVREL